MQTHIDVVTRKALIKAWLELIFRGSYYTHLTYNEYLRSGYLVVEEIDLGEWIFRTSLRGLP